jgi:hypothetical protein
MSLPIKVEVFTGDNLLPFQTNTYNLAWKEQAEFLAEDFCNWTDFPTGERLSAVFITNKQKVFEKWYVAEDGTLLTRFVFTAEKQYV